MPDVGIEHAILLFSWGGRVSIMGVPKDHRGPDLRLPDYDAFNRLTPQQMSNVTLRDPVPPMVYRNFRRISFDSGDCPIYIELR